MKRKQKGNLLERMQIRLQNRMHESRMEELELERKRTKLKKDAKTLYFLLGRFIEMI